MMVCLNHLAPEKISVSRILEPLENNPRSRHSNFVPSNFLGRVPNDSRFSDWTLFLWKGVRLEFDQPAINLMDWLCRSRRVIHFESDLSSRKLLSIGLRDPVCPFYGLLLDPDLHPIQLDRDHFVGIVLVESRCHTCSRQFGCDHCVDHDNVDGLNQCSSSKDLLCEIH